jgi:hypothetical protein
MTSSFRSSPRALPHAHGRGPFGALAACFAALLAWGVFAAAAQAAKTITWGSSLSAPPTRSLSAPVDAAYWQQATAPKTGQILTVTLWGRVLSGQPTILFQDLRPLGAGKLRVMSTTQPFKLAGTSAKRTFRPINFFVSKGDHVSLATIGGAYQVFATAPKASTEGSVGAGGDMNGSQFGGTVHHGIELLARMTERVG